MRAVKNQMVITFDDDGMVYLCLILFNMA